MSRDLIAAILEIKVAAALSNLPAQLANSARRSMQADFLLRR